METYQDLHSQVYNAIKASDSVRQYTSNVYDGLPNQLLRGVGYPMIIVNTPISSMNKLTLGARRWKSSYSIVVEIYAKRQSLAREIGDAVLEAVSEASYTGFKYNGLKSTDENVVVRAGDSKQFKEWSYVMTFSFEAVGEW